MSIFGFLLFLVLVGVGLWALGQFPAIDARIKKLITVIVIVLVVVASVFMIANLFGISTDLGGGLRLR